ncbi:ABC transporter permease [Kushneria indalinina]|uniref:Monosaccharide ABC transporter membrane protein (CUT2 family) n=1 Tax=Kushneria indalinina DSM 14324 TaxID=1122140 RepID=A0A3D9E077_9GAMM|nr:ABC transporter permease [Kushneria indalinina]REC96440.1 monosaccharide ABC transporter membrane protein (CUT2 family) [Kushneria indalinina DSM 14324]
MSTAHTETAARSRPQKTFSALFSRARLASLVVWIAFACYVVPLAIVEPQFISFYNIISILMLISVYALIGFGEGVVVLSGGIDLSVGSVVGLAGVVAALIMQGNTGIGWALIAIVGGVFAGIVIGMLNGIAVALLNIPAFVATLGTLSIALGFGYVLSNGQQISINNMAFLDISVYSWFGIPIPIYIMFAVFLLLWLTLSRTRLGRYVYAVGGNIQAAFVAGLPIRRVLISAFVISGALSGLAGVLLASQITAGIATTGTGYELIAIAAPVIGGISLAGGRGSIAGALFGVILLGTIDNGLTILNVSPFYQHIISGFIIILAVYLDTVANRRKLV